MQTKHVKFDEAKLGFEKTDYTTNQMSFEFPHVKDIEADQESNSDQGKQEDDQQQSDDKKSKRQYVRTEPIQT